MSNQLGTQFIGLHIKVRLTALFLLATFVSILVPLLSTSALANDDWSNQALPSSNRNPLVQIHALPQVATATLLTKGSSEWMFNSEIASLSSQNLTAIEAQDYLDNPSPQGESILLDGETWRSELSFRYGLNTYSDITIRIPYISHGGGFADNGIESWHQWFGLPNGNRNLRPDNALLYQYSVDGQQLISLDQQTHGMGDIQLEYRLALNHQQSIQQSIQQSLQKRSQSNTDINSVLQIAIKLDTGNTDKLTGSGSHNISVGVQFQQNSVARLKHLGWYSSTGLMWLEDKGLLQAQKKDWVFYANAGLSLRVTKGISLVSQLDLHSAVYKSKTEEIGATSGQLVIGLNSKLGHSTLVQFYFTEDILVKTSPDIGLGLSIRQTLN